MPERIEDYALLGDLQTAALVGRSGLGRLAVLPAFRLRLVLQRAARLPRARPLADRTDSTAARRPSGATATDTLILETEWQTATGRVRVIDFMPPRETKPGHRPDRRGPRGQGRDADGARRSASTTARSSRGSGASTTRRSLAIGGPDGARAPHAGRARRRRHDARRRLHGARGRAGAVRARPGTRRTSELPQPVDAEQALVETERLARVDRAAAATTATTATRCTRSLIVLKALTYAADRRRSSPRRRRRCPSGSAACATGTTATAGCATRRSRSTR